MKKVFLIAYTKLNLGDDIFLTILLEKYPNIDFFINIPEIEDRKFLKKQKNINFIEYQKKIDIDVVEYDAFVYIGGSVFMEHAWELEEYIEHKDFILRCKQLGKPFFYISSNFGPYKTEKYLELTNFIINNCKDVCFRDKYSYNLFSGISSVRYAPDLILSQDIRNIEVEKDTVGISIIDLSIRKDLVGCEEKYYNLLKNTIRMYIHEGKRVTLFSFCKFEGDEIGIEKLLKSFSAKELVKIRVVKYDGDIKTFIDEFKNVEYMIATRFHSLILSAVCGHKIYCLSYSKKLNNVIEDLNLEINIKNITDIEDENEKICIESFKNVDSKLIMQCSKRSKNQFRELEKIIKTNI